MKRVCLGVSLLAAIACLPLSHHVIAQSDDGEPEASAPRGYGREYGGRGGGYGGGGGYAGEYGGRGGYGLVAAEGENEPADNMQSPEEPIGEAIATDTSKASAAERIEATLNERLNAPLLYDEQPFNEIIDSLQEEYNIPILFDRAALEEVAISPETEISINLRNVSLRSALNLILRQPGLEDLTFVVDEEVLLITTEETANAALVVEVYRVDDLTSGYRQQRSGNENPYSSLVEVISQCVEYDSWMVNGKGEGEIRLMQPGMLVVSNTRRIHEQVRDLLEKLRSVHAKINKSRAEGGYGGMGRGRGGYGEGGRY